MIAPCGPTQFHPAVLPPGTGRFRRVPPVDLIP